VEFLLGEGFDVFLVGGGVPGAEDADLGVADYVCDELHWAVRETLRASGQANLTMAGWCIGAALSATDDVTHLDRPGGHIGLMAGSKARTQIWPDIAAWMAGRSAA
jgi:polyhydroxyalkanoate synthase